MEKKLGFHGLKTSSDKGQLDGKQGGGENERKGVPSRSSGGLRNRDKVPFFLPFLQPPLLLFHLPLTDRKTEIRRQGFPPLFSFAAANLTVRPIPAEDTRYGEPL